ncbi:MAG: hypothetical protein QOI83_2150, partial [Streptomycetaceae bacterium]|nr:hypothetical protein [Streptomycetaceae bacterium]
AASSGSHRPPGNTFQGHPGRDGAAPAPALIPSVHVRSHQFTRPYQTLRVQIFSSRTLAPVLGECQIFP